MNRQFPAIRGFAIFLVVLNHSIVLSLQAITQYELERTPIWIRNLLLMVKEMGVVAVPIFLFLAGAFMMYALKDKTIFEGYRLVLPALRNVIFPYLLWSAFFYLVFFLVRGETYSLFGYLKNLLVGYPFNFVPTLVFFIFISPLIAWALRRFPFITMSAIILYQILLVTIRLPGILGFSLPTWLGFLFIPVIGLPLALWAFFYPTGMLYIQYSEPFKNRLRAFLPVIITLTLVLFIIAVLKEIGTFDLPQAEWLLPMVFILLIPFINRKKIAFLAFFENLGKRSFGIYLLNLTVITLLVQAAANFIPWVFRLEPFLVIVLIAITILLITQFMAWVERTFSRKVYNFIFG